MQIIEAARAATGGGSVNLHYRRRLVFAQFHDYIPGSSVIEVYEEGVPEREALSQHALSKTLESFNAACGNEATESGAGHIFNPLANPVVEVIEEDDVVLMIPPLSVVPLSADRPVSESEPVIEAMDACGMIGFLAHPMRRAVLMRLRSTGRASP